MAPRPRRDGRRPRPAPRLLGRARRLGRAPGPRRCRDEWKAHLPSPALVEVKAAAAAARKADDALDGATWEAIGDAAGMTRQAAHGRWASRWQPVVTGEDRRPPKSAGPAGAGGG